MSDFSELCPLFSTGVYKELTIDNIYMTGVSTTSNALVGALTAAKYPGSIKFQRSVVVTKVYHRADDAPATACIILVGRRAATGTAANTAFASISCSTTSTTYPKQRWLAMTQAANKNFNAADVLNISHKATCATPGIHSFIIRYKER
jgi:hypothetical protein